MGHLPDDRGSALQSTDQDPADIRGAWIATFRESPQRRVDCSNDPKAIASPSEHLLQLFPPLRDPARVVFAAGTQHTRQKPGGTHSSCESLIRISHDPQQFISALAQLQLLGRGWQRFRSADLFSQRSDASGALAVVIDDPQEGRDSISKLLIGDAQLEKASILTSLVVPRSKIGSDLGSPSFTARALETFEQSPWIVIISLS